MLRSYLLSLYRNLLKNRLYSILNILGLTAGLTISFLIITYVLDELRYDRHFPDHERIYRLESVFVANTNVFNMATTPAPLGPTMIQRIPEIENMARLAPVGRMGFGYEDIQFIEENFYYADSSVFDLFHLKFTLGDPEKSLSRPFDIVLTESAWHRYFGNEDPVGKTISSPDGGKFRVTAVIADLPGNTHLRFDALLSMSTDPATFNNFSPAMYWKPRTYTYILLNKSADINTVHEKFLDYYKSEMEEIGKRNKVSFQLVTTPLTHTHFRSELSGDLPTGSMQYIRLFLAIALFVLIMAGINYTNLATARSIKRSREVGIRKVLGANRSDLIFQFVGESVLIALAAFILTILIAILLLPEFNAFTGKLLSLNPVHNGLPYIVMLIVAVLVGILSGIYPAFYLSSYQPVAVLKGSQINQSKGRKGIGRKVLVVFQFFTAILLLIGALAINRQLDYMLNRDLGYQKDNIVILEMPPVENMSSLQTFIDRLKQNPGILSATNTSGAPGRLEVRNVKVELESGMEIRPLMVIRVTWDFLDTWKIKLLKGRNFDPGMGTDIEQAVIINETAARQLGWGDDALGKRISYSFTRDVGTPRDLRVIGVVQDFYFRSLHDVVEPTMIILSSKPENYLACRLDGVNNKEALDFLSMQWRVMFGGHIFNYRYVTDSLEELYRSENKTATLIWIGTFFTIFIVLLGIIGLSSYITERKTKEIAIRKILGATFGNMWTLLSKEYFVLVLIAAVLSLPLAYYLTSGWLENNFAYYELLSWEWYFFSGLIPLLLGLLTITIFILQAFRKSPVEAIKYE
ncbi:MAG: ABC transporter permease [Bacteroidales bacterium]